MSKKFPVISLFSGAMGLDLGLEEAGFDIRVAVECNKYAIETIRRNRPDIKIIERRIENVTTEEILSVAGLRPGEPVLVTGGPSCQAFSTAGQRASMSDPRGVLFREFLRVVNEARPQFFVMENVRGLLSAAVKHRPLRERGPGHPPLSKEECLGSAFSIVLQELKRTGYYTVFDLLNTADFGVPQTRERIIFIGSRDGLPVQMPKRTHSKDGLNGTTPWASLRDALKGLRDSKPVYLELSPLKKRFLRHIPTGGNWRNLPRRSQVKALGKAFTSWGGRSGFFRRLSWDRPSPSLLTTPDGKATMLCHPSRLRPLSVAEYSRIQQFPDQWEFLGGVRAQYTQIGNAVPVGLGKALGQAVIETMEGTIDRSHKFIVECANREFLDRLTRRPSTMLNPKRMRKIKGIVAAQKWLNGLRRRKDILNHVSVIIKEKTPEKGILSQKRQDAEVCVA